MRVDVFNLKDPDATDYSIVRFLQRAGVCVYEDDGARWRAFVCHNDGKIGEVIYSLDASIGGQPAVVEHVVKFGVGDNRDSFVRVSLGRYVADNEPKLENPAAVVFCSLTKDVVSRGVIELHSDSQLCK